MMITSSPGKAGWPVKFCCLLAAAAAATAATTAKLSLLEHGEKMAHTHTQQ